MKPEKDKDPMPEEFAKWWEPTGIDSKTGVSIGGHPEAWRMWARTDDGGKSYARKPYGITAELAWICQEYRDAFNEWIMIGAPPAAEPFESYALPLEEQKKRWEEIRPLIAKIETRVTHDRRGLVVPEDTRLKGYDKR